MATYFINTDARHNGGRSFDQEWLNRKIAATGGARRFRDALERIKQGDQLLMYVNGRGVCAVGIAIDNNIRDVTSTSEMINRTDASPEYHRNVDWRYKLDKPLTWGEIARICGQGPTRSVQLVSENKIQELLSCIDRLPTANHSEYERRSFSLLGQGIISKPTGNEKPDRVTSSATAVIVRCPEVKAYGIQRAKGRCELCGKEAPFERENGIGYLELHHIQPLAENGTDTPENTAAVCPNCHRELHYGIDSKNKTAILRQLRHADEVA